MVVRCTVRLLDGVGTKRSSLPEVAIADDDWYANLLWIARRKCLLVTHAGTAFSAFAADVRKADLVPLGPAVERMVGAALEAEGLPRDALGTLDGADARLAATASRRVLGRMNELAFLVRHEVFRTGSIDVDTLDVASGLQRTLHTYGRRHATPLDLVRERVHG
jgi:hypothetical protein